MTRCPRCDYPLDDRFYDEEAQMSYPCDDGEGYCRSCDEIVSTEPEEVVDPVTIAILGLEPKELPDGSFQVAA